MKERSSNAGLNRVVRRMAMFLCCVLLFEGLLIAVAPRLHSGSVLKIAKDSLLLRARTDSWAYMAQGDLAWRQHPHAIYETVFFERDIRFIYPPTSLLIYRTWLAPSFVGLQPFTALKITLLLSLLGTWFAASEFFFLMLPVGIVGTSTAAERWKIRLLI